MRRQGHRYGRVHKDVRKHFLLRMERGETFACWRCMKPIDPRRPWDLGHVGDNTAVGGRRWPEHRGCNRATLTHIAEKYGGLAGRSGTAHADAMVRQEQEDRFDGLPDPTPTNSVDRWSMHWAGGFNPRCPDCRRLRGPC